MSRMTVKTSCMNRSCLNSRSLRWLRFFKRSVSVSLIEIGAELDSRCGDTRGQSKLSAKRLFLNVE